MSRLAGERDLFLFRLLVVMFKIYDTLLNSLIIYYMKSSSLFNIVIFLSSLFHSEVTPSFLNSSPSVIQLQIRLTFVLRTVIQSNQIEFMNRIFMNQICGFQERILRRHLLASWSNRNYNNKNLKNSSFVSTSWRRIL